jgi:hypothetical protein
MTEQNLGCPSLASNYDYGQRTSERLAKELGSAEKKAFDALARYKFTMFGYWSGVWVHLNRISGNRRPNPFRDLVKVARCRQVGDPAQATTKCRQQHDRTQPALRISIGEAE